MKKIATLITCEHAVDIVPDEYQSLFVPYKALLASHRGIDFGALTIARHLEKMLKCPLVQATATRLLVDCNRSATRNACFSEITQALPLEEKKKILGQYYLPFRQQILENIKLSISQGFQVLHLSIHSFTPVWNNRVRNAEIGLLYDPRRTSEKTLAKQLLQEIKVQNPSLRVRMNYPYLGISDGFTSDLRKLFAGQDYLGIEIEFNQALTQITKSLNNLQSISTNSILKIIC